MKRMRNPKGRSKPDIEGMLLSHVDRINKVCSSLLRNRPDLSSHRNDIISDGMEIALVLMSDGDVEEDEFGKILSREMQKRSRKYSPRMEVGIPDDLYDNIPDEGSDLSEIVDSKIMSDALMTCISNLPSMQREAIILYYYCGLTQDEAAKRIGIKQAGFSRRLGRARRRMAEDLERMGLSPSE